MSTIMKLGLLHLFFSSLLCPLRPSIFKQSVSLPQNELYTDATEED